jgi:membrane-associated phospholipid phosphatase
MLYRISSGSLDHGFDLARQNAYHIVDLERSLGIFIEQDFQSFFMDNAFLTRLVDTLYTILYYPALILFAIWAFTYHRQEYITVRNIFLVSAAIAFTCFALFPVAPPRMLPELGFIDSMAEHGVVQYESGFLGQITNPYAAMPSCHFAWTLLIGTAIFHMARSWWLKIVGIIVPLGMLISIVATANHYILDALAGAVVIGLSAGIVRLLGTWRREIKSPVLEDFQ